MPTFLILYRTGPGPADLKVVGVSENKRAKEAEKAIAETTTEGEGEYIAVPFNDDQILRKQAQNEIVLADPVPESDANIGPGPSVPEPEPEPAPPTEE